jgi:phage baseplate assembly protein W
MSARGQKFTVQWKTPIYYADFLDSFETDPQTGALAVVTNVDSIEQSIRNLVETDPGERPGRCSVGGKVRATLFSLGTPQDLELLQTTISDVIRVHEPRAQDPVVTVDQSTVQSDAVRATVEYTPINLPQRRRLALSLSRVR